MYTVILTLCRVVGLAQAKMTNTAWVPTALGESSFPSPSGSQLTNNSEQQAGGMGAGYNDSYQGGNTGGGGYDDNEGEGKSKDSTLGKMMEKGGKMFKNEGMAEKGRAKRDEASGMGGNNDY